MQLSWHWPWAGLAGAVIALAIIVLIMLVSGMRKRPTSSDAQSFSLDDDLNTESASRLFRQWRVLSRTAVAVLVIALTLAVALVARPGKVDEGEERASSRDIVLCLDVSGSTLPYDREVIDTYGKMLDNFKGERIGLSIFNSTSRTVFPLTDDYELVSKQLDKASGILKGVESQDDIDKMKESDYQALSDWLEGTQNRKESTSLIGDGVVSCAAMLPGFAYGNASATNADRQRAASIVLATDNVVSGKPTYTLSEALDLTQQARISVDGLFSGPKQSESDQTTKDFKSAIETRHGVFLTQSDGASVSSLVKEIESRRSHESQARNKAAITDAPGWWTFALAVVLMVWLALTWRLRR
ncbi:MAG TPA: VWA domain-containing protein [Bifidobacterium sp.]|nr:VWA domain-containing protein [Bifidobacterium sp.]